jgi:hypothetical protein
VASGFYLMLVLLLLGALTNPALAKMYSCRDAAGQGFRPAKCEKGETRRVARAGGNGQVGDRWYGQL